MKTLFGLLQSTALSLAISTLFASPVAAGALHSLALRDDGTVVAWGSDLDADDHFVGQATVPAGLFNVVAIAAGDYHSVAVRADGSVVAWGANAAGQTNVPSDLTNAVAVAAAGSRNVALRVDSTLLGWGENPQVPAGLTNILAVALGAAHGLALTAQGTVFTWDDNDDSQLDVPDGLSNVVAIAAGGYHCLALIGPISPIRLQLSDPALVANAFTVRTATRDRHTYVLGYKNALADTNWTALPGIRGYGYGVMRRVSDPAPAVHHRFYRITENP